LKYKNTNEYTLKKINFSIKPNEKIGFFIFFILFKLNNFFYFNRICGKSGSGKSTILNALLKVVEIRGKIIIDNINIKDIGLTALRRNISVVAQNPVLFKGTVDSNLDPFNQHTEKGLIFLIFIF
jgi:ABC-type multidrug transport system fused ATPase/permease subunit